MAHPPRPRRLEPGGGMQVRRAMRRTEKAVLLGLGLGLVVLAVAACGPGTLGAGGIGGGDGGISDCDQAEQHLSGCSSQAGGPVTGSCTGMLLCRAQCINQFTCAQISGNAPAYTACLAACQGK